MNEGTIKGIIAAAVLAVLGGGYALASLETVAEGSVAVVYSTKGAEKEPLPSGWHFISPLKKTIEYPIRFQTLTTEQFNSPTSEGKSLTVEVNYQYLTDQTKVVSLYKTYGKQDMQEVTVVDKAANEKSDAEQHQAMKSISLTKDIQSITRDILRKHTLDEIYISQTDAINAEIIEAVNAKEKEKGFEIKELFINIPNLDEATQNALNAKVQETQNQQLKTQQLETAKLDAEKIEIETEAAANQKRIQAQAQADAVLIQAQADAEANKLKQQTLTPELIQAQWIAQWNGQLPQVQGEGMPIIQMPAATAEPAE